MRQQVYFRQHFRRGNAPGEAMTLAAVDRLVHHSIIFELNVESYRRKTALSRKTNAANPFQPTTSDASS